MSLALCHSSDLTQYRRRPPPPAEGLMVEVYVPRAREGGGESLCP
jgi:hypothetical protein